MRNKLPELTRQRERKILDAAQLRFAAYGEQHATMDEIAADVGMGKATLYYYFPCKEQLFRAVIAREQEQFLLQLRKIAAKTDEPSDKLREYVQHRVRYFHRLVNLNALSIQSILEMKPIYRELFQRFAVEERKLIAKIITDGNQSGHFEVDNPDEVATVLLHALHGLRWRALRIASHNPVPAVDPRELLCEMRLLVDYLIKGFANVERTRIETEPSRKPNRKTHG